MEFGKIINGELVRFERPQIVVVGGTKYSNPSDTRIKEAGYKEIREDVMPMYDTATEKLETKVYENEDVIYIKHLVSPLEEN